MKFCPVLQLRRLADTGLDYWQDDFFLSQIALLKALTNIGFDESGFLYLIGLCLFGQEI